MGIILETFHSAGTLPEVKLLLKRSARVEEMYEAQHLSNFAGILSGPVIEREKSTSSGEMLISLMGSQKVVVDAGWAS
jgi:hypothetical protein